MAEPSCALRERAEERQTEGESEEYSGKGNNHCKMAGAGEETMARRAFAAAQAGASRVLQAGGACWNQDLRRRGRQGNSARLGIERTWAHCGLAFLRDEAPACELRGPALYVDVRGRDDKADALRAVLT